MRCACAAWRRLITPVPQRVFRMHVMEQPKRSKDLLNGTELAEEINIGRTGVQAMKKLGYKFTHGRKTTKRSALQWLRDHPNFRQRMAYQRKGTSASPKQSRPVLSLTVSVADKRGEQSLKHA